MTFKQFFKVLAVCLGLVVPMLHAQEYRILQQSDQLVIRTPLKLQVLDKFQNSLVVEMLIKHFQLLHQMTPTKVKGKIGKYKWIIGLEKIANRDALFIPPGQHNFPYAYGPKEIYISIDPLAIFADDFLTLISHEYFHGIHYLYAPNSPTWIKEGMAMYFEFLVHESLNPSSVGKALSQSTTALEGVYNIHETQTEQYGHNLLFFYYLFDHCLKNHFWKVATSSTIKDLSSLDEVLSFGPYRNKKKECKSAKTAASYFTIARAHNRFSGYSQNPSYFLLNYPIVMPVNKQFELNYKKLSPAMRAKFWKKLNMYQPIVVSIDFYQMYIRDRSDYPLTIIFLQDEFPFKVSHEFNVSVSVQDTNVLLFKSDD